jgi:uncharacterized protein (DUF433 family)
MVNRVLTDRITLDPNVLAGKLTIRGLSTHVEESHGVRE